MQQSNMLIKTKFFKSNKINNILFFLISIFFIYLNKEYYLISFIKNYQVSYPSMASYLYAYGNIFREDIALLVPKYLFCDLSLRNSDGHWLNTYYLLFTPLVNFFGTNFYIGRIFPLCLNLIGLLLISYGLNINKKIIILLPFLLFTSTIKDSFAFNFHDSLFLLVIGFFLIIYKNIKNKYGVKKICQKK